MAGVRHYRFLDWATQGYVACVALLILLFHGDAVDGWGWLVLAHLVCLGLTHALILRFERSRATGWLAFVRYLYPVMLYTAFYRETGLVNQMFVTGYLDPWVIRAEQSLLGFQPCLAFMDWAPYLWLSEFFYAFYFSYYVMIAGVGIALFLRDRAQCHHYVAVVSFVFYLCYLTYIFIPVVGPRLFFREINGYQLPADLLALAQVPEYPESITHGPFFQLMRVIYRHFEAEGAAFPSSHVAIALCTLHFSWRYLPRIRWFHAFAVSMLCLSTVYCRYHYLLDVIFGILTAALLLPLGNALYTRFERRAESQAQTS